ncbi:hypothetical protein N7474_000282 [Penicillium riverlandense]|uniref:uncharacterized protein n=1 Tax=Penicillium riverlandense TaxID=1903569 RepID=UPI0025466A9A|nr:uncharacterized protein N7474_000282 [Penicillium riverlandense]KAJ5831971.1 hypothetical protein N7474_000282 [Penicillium riverlandense]
MTSRSHFLRVLLRRVERPSNRVSRRTLSTSPPPPRSSPSSPKDSRSRLRQLNDRLPRFLRTLTTPLLGAPVTHVTSFLILHEITAVVPLFGLVAAFHYGGWMPDLTSDGENNAFEEGTARFGKWLRKKGWVDEADVNAVAEHEATTDASKRDKDRTGVRLLLEFATAYAITKALLPVRIAASVGATPWFARTILTPTANTARRLLGRS